ncbi:hypothetical protein [Primorskyibacter marinus]|nr:hypothetical protein [Primorskyibacter marinus]
MTIQTVRGIKAPRPRPTLAAAFLVAVVLSLPAAIVAIVECLV